MAKPALIVAGVRTGGTFLAHCLSNHPAIFCDRGEPLHHRSAWVGGLHCDRRLLLGVLLNQTGYKISMCKLTYEQAMGAKFWPIVQELAPAILWLRRENVIRQAVSVLINRRARAGKIERAQHSMAPVGALSVSLAPAEVLGWARRLSSQNKLARKRLKGFRVLPLTYEAITAPGGRYASAGALSEGIAVSICDFLEVRRVELGCDLVRINAAPLSQLIKNWAEVERAIQRSEFAHCLTTC